MHQGLQAVSTADSFTAIYPIKADDKESNQRPRATHADDEAASK